MTEKIKTEGFEHQRVSGVSLWNRFFFSYICKDWFQSDVLSSRLVYLPEISVRLVLSPSSQKDDVMSTFHIYKICSQKNLFQGFQKFGLGAARQIFLLDSFGGHSITT